MYRRLFRTAAMLMASCAFSLFVSIPEASARRVEECGVEYYDYQRASSCPAESFFVARTQACGVEQFNAKRDKSCPGYLSRDVTTRSGRGSAAVSCPSGYRETGRSQSGGCAECNKPQNHPVTTTVTCERAEFVPTCRLQAFGVESFKSCRHSSHGVEVYTACVQLPIFNDCAILKTRTELDAFLQEKERSIPVTGRLLVSNQGLVASLSGNADALACLIKTWESDPLYTDIVDQLRGNFQNLTGRGYTPDSCTGQSNPTFSCAPGDTSEICRAQFAVADARSYFLEVSGEVAALRDDVVPRNESRYRDALDALSSKLAEFLR